MITKRSWLRHLATTLPGLGLAGWLTWSGAAARAQDMNNTSGPVRTFLNKTTIQLPIIVDERNRPQLQSVQLWVKEGPAGAWRLTDKAMPNQPSFTFRAPQDGEYWFNIVSVDRTGRSIPADVTREHPALIVMIDTQAPQVEVQPLQSAPEGHYVRFQCRDPHLDLSKTRLHYQTADMAWRPLDAVPGKAETYCVPAQAAWTGNVRAVAVDLAGNVAARDLHINGSSPVASTAPPSNTVVETMVAPAGNLPPSNPIVVTSAPTVPQLTPSPQAPQTGAPPSENVIIVSPSNSIPQNIVTSAPMQSNPPQLVQPAPALTRPKLPDPSEIVVPVSQPPVQTRNVVENTPSNVVHPNPRPTPERRESSEVTTVVQKIAPPQLFDPALVRKTPTLNSAVNDQKPTPPALRDHTTLQRQFVASTRVFLDYRIEALGASGVGKVEVWHTRDLGQSWQKLCEDNQRQTPVEVTLPGEGLHGVTMVVSNGRGFGGNPPSPGDTPDYWIEVDTTRPVADLVYIRPGSGEDAAALHIAWTARDKNLATDSVELQYAAKPQGPWHVIAKGLKGEGVYRWNPPVEVGTHAYVRLSARDYSGNTATAETNQPVALDDNSRPRGRVLGVTTTPPSRTGIQQVNQQ